MILLKIMLHSLKGDSSYTMALQPHLGKYQDRKHLTGSWIGAVGENLRLAALQALWALRRG